MDIIDVSSMASRQRPELIRMAMTRRVDSSARLLFLVTEDWYFCSHRLPLAQAAVNAGFEVSVATRVTQHEEQIRAAGIRVFPFKMTRRGFNPLAEFLTLFRLISLYRYYRPDIVHHVALKPVVYGSLAAAIARIPSTVNAIAGFGYAFSSSDGTAKLLKTVVGVALPRLLNRRGSRVIVQNPDDRAALHKLGVEQQRIALIAGAGVNQSEFRVDEEAPSPITVTLAGRMIWDKGIQEFVEAARVVKNRLPETRFVLVGKPDPGNPNAVSTEQLEQWNRDGPVEWLGFRSDMPRVLRESHVVCLPSSYGEGIPKILIEAAASGKPIVATDIPGCREIVRHGESGYLVSPGDHNALVAALADLIGSAAKRREMGRRGRDLVDASFTLDRVIADTLALYREAQRE